MSWYCVTLSELVLVCSNRSTAHNGLCPSPRLYVGDFSYNFLVGKIPSCLKYLPRYCYVIYLLQYCFCISLSLPIYKAFLQVKFPRELLPGWVLYPTASFANLYEYVFCFLRPRRITINWYISATFVCCTWVEWFNHWNTKHLLTLYMLYL